MPQQGEQLGAVDAGDMRKIPPLACRVLYGLPEECARAHPSSTTYIPAYVRLGARWGET